MAYLFGYKLIDNGKRIGFPDTALENIKYELDGQKISYAVFNINDEPSIKDYHKLNTYPMFLKEAKYYIDKELLLDSIIYKIKNLDLKRLENLVEAIDDYLR